MGNMRDDVPEGNRDNQSGCSTCANNGKGDGRKLSQGEFKQIILLEERVKVLGDLEVKHAEDIRELRKTVFKAIGAAMGMSFVISMIPVAIKVLSEG